MKPLKIATDLSASSSNAVWYATDMALAINADLVLVHIGSITLTATQDSMLAGMSEWQKSAEIELRALNENITWKRQVNHL